MRGPREVLEGSSRGPGLRPLGIRTGVCKGSAHRAPARPDPAPAGARGAAGRAPPEGGGGRTLWLYRLSGNTPSMPFAFTVLHMLVLKSNIHVHACAAPARSSAAHSSLKSGSETLDCPGLIRDWFRFQVSSANQNPGMAEILINLG